MNLITLIFIVFFPVVAGGLALVFPAGIAGAASLVAGSAFGIGTFSKKIFSL